VMDQLFSEQLEISNIYYSVTSTFHVSYGYKLLTACFTVRGKPSRMKPDSPLASPFSRRLDNRFIIISSDTNLPWFTISASYNNNINQWIQISIICQEEAVTFLKNILLEGQQGMKISKVTSRMFTWTLRIILESVRSQVHRKYYII